MDAAFSGILMLGLLRPPLGLRRYLPYLIVLFVSVLLVYSLAVLNLLPGSGILLSPITTLTGKDLTFSGRTAIWAIIRRAYRFTSPFGSGYGAYWVNLPTSPSMEMLRRCTSIRPKATMDTSTSSMIWGDRRNLPVRLPHCVFCVRACRLFAALRPQGVLYLTLLFHQLIANLTESRWFNTLSCEFVIMTIATVAMGRTLLDGRCRAGRRLRPCGWRSARNSGRRSDFRDREVHLRLSDTCVASLGRTSIGRLTLRTASGAQAGSACRSYKSAASGDIQSTFSGPARANPPKAGTQSLRSAGSARFIR